MHILPPTYPNDPPQVLLNLLMGGKLDSIQFYKYLVKYVYHYLEYLEWTTSLKME